MRCDKVRNKIKKINIKTIKKGIDEMAKLIKKIPKEELDDITTYLNTKINKSLLSPEQEENRKKWTEILNKGQMDVGNALIKVVEEVRKLNFPANMQFEAIMIILQKVVVKSILSSVLEDVDKITTASLFGKMVVSDMGTEIIKEKNKMIDTLTEVNKQIGNLKTEDKKMFG